ncbi:Stearoyl-CoA desaturase 5 [Halotydeus destructor]|nr:Stearoyl-CoA desaturase 5 [Halotydeus destructor]
MPPCTQTSDAEVTTEPGDSLTKGAVKGKPMAMVIVWKNVFLFVLLHASLFYSLYALFVYRPWNTLIFSVTMGFAAGLGVTAGAHRLWSHKSYKAKLPFRIFLAMMQTVAGQNDIYEWCRDHRVHHKYSETDADPHNANRGFFFAHMGWLCCRKHPDVIQKGKTIDLSDLLEDPVVRFQKKYYILLATLFCFVLPTLIPWYFWNEHLLVAYMMSGLSRYCLSLHGTWLVNSAAHMWGNRPYDNKISARENRHVSFLALGEGWHNYHHTFPWDYATSEMGYEFNLSKMLIDAMAYCGQAYDLRTVSHDMIVARKKRTGDGTPTVEHDEHGH